MLVSLDEIVQPFFWLLPQDAPLLPLDEWLLAHERKFKPVLWPYIGEGCCDMTFEKRASLPTIRA